MVSFDEARVQNGAPLRGSGGPDSRELALPCPVEDRPFRINVVVRYPYLEQSVSSVRLVGA